MLARHRLTTYDVILSNTRGKRALVIFCADSRFKAVSTNAVIFTFASHFSTSPAERLPTLQMLPVPVFPRGERKSLLALKHGDYLSCCFHFTPSFPTLSFSPSRPQLPANVCVSPSRKR